MARKTAARPGGQRPAAGRGPASGVSGTWTSFAVLVAATATVLMLQATRVFVSYLIFVVDQGNRIELGVIVLGVFAAVGLGGLLRRLLGWPLTIGITAGGLAVARLALQFWNAPEPRLVLGAVVVVCWGWLMTALLQSLRDAAALGVLLGLALDVTIRIGFQTVDLPWMPNTSAHGITAVLVVILAFSALMLAVLDDPPISAGSAFSLIGVGPGLALFHMMTGNLGLAQTLVDIDFPAASGMIALGTILGLVLTSLAAAPSSGLSWVRAPRIDGAAGVFILAGLGAIALWFFWQRPGLTGIAVVLGVAGSYVLMALALLDSTLGRRGIAGSVSLWLTLGLLIQAVLLFTYYTFTGSPIVIIVTWALLLAGAFVSGTRLTADPAWQLASPRAWFAITGVLLLFVTAQQDLEWSAARVRDPLPNDLKVITYNIQSGFSRDNIFDLEKTAATIETNDPDVVVLQEVSRGWLVTTGIDQALWLSQRLNMPFYFGAASSDGLWGNLILTNAPVSDELRRNYTSSENFRRGTVGVEVETEAGPLWVFGTHLDNPDDAGDVRLEQVDQLLSFWNGRTPAVIAGDFNTDPDSDVVQRMSDAGFDDPGARLGDGTTSQDNRRIDYIFTSAGVDVREIRVFERWTSDHLPVTARMVLQE